MFDPGLTPEEYAVNRKQATQDQVQRLREIADQLERGEVEVALISTEEILAHLPPPPHRAGSIYRTDGEGTTFMLVNVTARQE